MSVEGTARRIVSIWLPHYPMERWLKRQDQQGNAASGDLPVALSIDGPHGPVVHATNRAARLAGVATGARVVDMRALCPALHVDYADPGGDAAALTRLAFWARRWCPWTATDGMGLILDTTGSAHLHGGEAAMLTDIATRLALAGFTARPAIAPTWGAAWALARFGPVRAIWQGPADTAPLPAAALRLSPDTILLLQRLGLKTIGDLAALPRLALARRFAATDPADNPLLRLDQLTGHQPEPLAPPEAAAPFVAEIRLLEPIQDPTHHLPALCRDLCAQLSACAQGARRLALTVYRSDGETSTIATATASPSRDPAHLAFLFRDRLERIDPGFGFDLVTLDAAVTEPMAPAQTTLAGSPDATLDLARLIDRLTVRFGAGALSQPQARASHIPERAEAPAPPLATATHPSPPTPLRNGEGGAAGPFVPILAGGLAAQPGTRPPRTASYPPAQDRTTVAFRPPLPPGEGPGERLSQPPPMAPAERPQRLLHPPEEIRVLYAVPEGPPAQFIWRRQVHRTMRTQGPERIAPEWWQDRPGTRLRDYFKVEDDRGRRYWLYREGLHDDGRGGDPRWFLHGIFA